MLTRILFVISTTLVFLTACFQDPYRKRDIETLDTGIVLKAEVISGKQLLNENPEIILREQIDAVLMVFSNLNFTYVSESDKQINGSVRALVKTLSGKKIRLYHPDPNLRTGDCLDLLRVDGRQMIAYAAECNPKLLTPAPPDSQPRN